MTTLWGDRQAGQDFAVGTDELGVHVIYGEPDRIRTPAEIGGQEYRVSSAYSRECPCAGSHEAKTYTLEKRGPICK